MVYARLHLQLILWVFSKKLYILDCNFFYSISRQNTKNPYPLPEQLQTRNTDILHATDLWPTYVPYFENQNLLISVPYDKLNCLKTLTFKAAQTLYITHINYYYGSHHYCEQCKFHKNSLRMKLAACSDTALCFWETAVLNSSNSAGNK